MYCIGEAHPQFSLVIFRLKTLHLVNCKLDFRFSYQQEFEGGGTIGRNFLARYYASLVSEGGRGERGRESGFLTRSRVSLSGSLRERTGLSFSS